MTRAPAVLAGATLVYALFIFGGYFGNPWQQPLLGLLQLGFMLLLATGAGRVVLRALGVADISESQKTLIGATLGLGLLSLLAFALCASGGLYVTWLMTALAALWVVGATEMRQVIVSLGANRNLLRERPLATAALLTLLALSLWMTFAPPHQYDALVYHLPLPAAYIRAHRFVTVPTIVYGHFPQNGEMLFTIALLLKNDLLAQMFSWLAGALAVGWLFEFGKREAPLSAVLLGCLILASQTAFMLLSSIAYVETFVTLWLTASLLTFLRWRQLESRGWLALSAIFLGLALGTKYYAGIAAVLLGLWLIGRRRWADVALFVGVTTLVFSPWLVKNAVMAGNPVFPFFNRWFAAGAGWNQTVAQGYFGALTEYRSLHELWKLPALMLTNDPRFGGGMDVLGTLGWDLTFWSLPVALWFCRRNTMLRALALFCLAYVACWAATGVVLRFLLVLAPALALLAGNGLYALHERLSEAGRAVLIAGVGLLAACHLLLFFFVEFGVYGAAPVVLGAQTRDQFLAARLDYYPCARFVAEHSGKTDKILIVGEQRSYYVDRDHTATSVQAPNAFLAWADEAATPADLGRRIEAAGYARAILVPRELARLGDSVGRLTPRAAANWQGLPPLFRAPACVVY